MLRRESLMLFALVGALSTAQAATPSVVAGSLLTAPRDATEPMMIRPQEELTPNYDAELAEQGDFALDDPPKKTKFHIISGPDKSDYFIGHHYSGMVNWSDYQEQPWGEPHRNIWRHYEYGPNKSLYWKQSF